VSAAAGEGGEGSSDESDEDSEGGGHGGGGGGDAGDIEDETGTDVVNLRRTIYLTIMSSLDFEEAGHKLMKIQLRPGQVGLGGDRAVWVDSCNSNHGRNGGARPRPSERASRHVRAVKWLGSGQL
jgi:hypothetical protein